MEDIEDAWQNFCEDDIIGGEPFSGAGAAGAAASPPEQTLQGSIPKCSPLNISTKTKIAYLNIPIDLKHVFWNIPLITYHLPHVGVVKKQMKFNSATMAEVEEIIANTKKYDYTDEYIISKIHNPEGRSKFKDIRKLSFGLCKKDINSYRCKKKSAFYNCFVLIIRLKCNEIFKEFHVKIFNTGKMEIPGIQCEETYEKLLLYVAALLQPLHQFQEIDAVPLATIGENLTVLINSNFNCNYHINLEKLVHILTSTYNIQCIYDPCSYPGVQCKFYYNHSLEKQTGSQISHEDKDKYPRITKVSFMIFRTGSVLIVGMCDDAVLHFIYDFLVKILFEEYHAIFQPTPACIEIRKAKKPRKKTIYLK